MAAKTDLLQEPGELREQIQELQAQRQPDEIDSFLNDRMPEPFYSQAIAQKIPPHFATNRLKITRLIVDNGLQTAFDYAIGSIRGQNPRGNIDFQLSMARAAVGKVSFELHYKIAQDIREQAVKPLPAWKRKQM